MENKKGKNLYEFWGDSIAKDLAKDAKALGSKPFLINVASQEYFKAVNTKVLGFPVYTMLFPGPTVYAKRARGEMARFAIVNNVSNPEQLKKFTGTQGEWTFSAASSSEFKLSFSRSATLKPAKKKEAKTRGPPKQRSASKKAEDANVAGAGGTKRKKEATPAAEGSKRRKLRSAKK